MTVRIDERFIQKFVKPEQLLNMQAEIDAADQQLRQKSGKGSQYTEWLEWANQLSDNDLKKINQAAKKIQEQSQVLVVIGIGGSYLGARAVIEFLNGLYPIDQKTEVLFAGNSLSGAYYQELIRYIGDRDFSINVISKSGTTTEPAIGYRIFKELLDKKYGDQSDQRIYMTTDESKGTLRDLATQKNYQSFVVPDGIGGRFSVLTAVGLLPIATAGIDINQLMNGAKQATNQLVSSDINQNMAARYAAYRNLLFRADFDIEIFANFEPSIDYLSEWWKQLMGESEGKDKTGIFPTSVSFTTDLHSMGQYIQDGRRNLFETVIKVNQMNDDLKVPLSDNNDDQLEYLQGRSLTEINNTAIEGVLIAHNDGGVPALIIEIDKQDPFDLGYLIYFFELSVALSGYLNGINPFDQEGVEDYKKNMFSVLGKPGY